ncbi:MAG: hypothetical protein M0005_02315 [Actinomycetota bacterium]|nr:hypothetical protein [Actinomycetota bacterium]
MGEVRFFSQLSEPDRYLTSFVHRPERLVLATASLAEAREKLVPHIVVAEGGHRGSLQSGLRL